MYYKKTSPEVRNEVMVLFIKYTKTRKHYLILQMVCMEILLGA